MSQAGIGIGWLFWIQSTTCSPGAGRGKPRVAICGPSVGVVRRGERAIGAVTIAAGDVGAGIAKCIEGVFDDVVPGRSDDVNEQLTAEFGEAKRFADFAAVEDDHAPGRSAALAPLGEDPAITGE